MATINKIKIKDTNYDIKGSLMYGVCSTAAGTAAKTVTVDGSFTLYTGAMVAVKFTYTNTASTPTLNVNGSGGKQIKIYGTTAASNSTITSWTAGQVVIFVYDGNYWQRTFNDTDTDTDTKVTAVGNHYTPTADISAALSADASSSTAATWNSTALVTGVNLQRDAKGHVVEVTVDSIKMPANPNSDTKYYAGTNVTIGSDNKISTLTTKTNVSGGHIYLTGADTGSSTANTTQLVFGTESNNHVAISSNDKAIVINPSTNSTSNQIVLYLNSASHFPNGVNKAIGDGNGNVITDTYLTKATYNENIITDSEIDTIFGATLTSVTYSLGTNCVSSNTFEGIYNGDSYITTLSTVNNYKITEVKVLMNNTDITSSVYNSNSKTIHIPTVNGTVKVTATTRAPYTYTVTYNLTKCSSSNTATTVQEGQSYNTEITCTSSYYMQDCTASMSGGTATVTRTTGRKYIVEVPEVTGNITITGYADN